MNALLAPPPSAAPAVASDSVRLHHRREAASSGSGVLAAVEALHKSEHRLIVDGDGSTTSSAGQQRCRPDVHPRIERHGS